MGETGNSETFNMIFESAMFQAGTSNILFVTVKDGFVRNGIGRGASFPKAYIDQ